MAVWTFIFDDPGKGSGLAGDADRQGLVAFDETRIYPLRFVDHFNIIVPLEDFFPDNQKLQLRKPDSDATVDAEAEGNVGAGAGAVDDEVVGTVDHVLVAVPRNVPHYDLVALLDLLAAELDVSE